MNQNVSITKMTEAQKNKQIAHGLRYGADLMNELGEIIDNIGNSSFRKSIVAKYSHKCENMKIILDEKVKLFKKMAIVSKRFKDNIHNGYNGLRDAYTNVVEEFLDIEALYDTILFLREKIFRRCLREVVDKVLRKYNRRYKRCSENRVKLNLHIMGELAMNYCMALYTKSRQQEKNKRRKTGDDYFRFDYILVRCEHVWNQYVDMCFSSTESIYDHLDIRPCRIFYSLDCIYDLHLFDKFGMLRFFNDKEVRESVEKTLSEDQLDYVKDEYYDEDEFSCDEEED